MKHYLLHAAIGSSILCAACGSEQKSGDETVTQTTLEFKDYGADPIVLDIEAYTLGNDNFRTALWTGDNLQLTLMSIPVGGEVGLECHHDIDQFLRIESGRALVEMGDSRDRLDFSQEAGDDFAILVPAGKWHNIVNKGKEPLKLYSIYAPAEHDHGTVHRTYEEAMAAEAEHHRHEQQD